VQVVIEAVAEALHLPVQLFFAGMRKGRMADVVRERESFGQIFIEAKRDRNCASDLRYLDRVSEAIPEVIVQTGCEDLCLILQSPECPGVNDTIAVALEFVSIRVRQLGITPPLRAFNRKSKPT
jgi:hypothetical protein